MYLKPILTQLILVVRKKGKIVIYTLRDLENMQIDSLLRLLKNYL